MTKQLKNGIAIWFIVLQDTVHLGNEDMVTTERDC